MIRIATDEEIDQWDELILANPDGGNLFQSRELAETKSESGWTPRYLIAGEIALTIHERSVPFLGQIWYLPKGPGVATTEDLGRLVDELREFARGYGVFALKIEPELPRDPRVQLPDPWQSARAIQPNSSTIILDILPSLENVLASLNQKGRHAIRRAERDGVTARAVEFTGEHARTMYELLALTARAQGFRVRTFEYHYGFWRRFVEQGHGQLFFAYHEDQVVAAAFAINFGHKGTYKDGASIRERAAYGASHLIQWTIIQWMKTRGVTQYDLCGTPPSDQINNPAHPHHNIGRFKASFSKLVTDYIGAYDIPVRPLVYRFWAAIGERLVLRLHSRLHGENWY